MVKEKSLACQLCSVNYDKIACLFCKDWQAEKEELNAGRNSSLAKTAVGIRRLLETRTGRTEKTEG